MRTALHHTGFADLDVVLDPHRVAEVVGRADVRVTRLRHKAGEYTVAALADADGPSGWMRVTGHRRRADKDCDLARTVRVHELGYGLFATTGPLTTDPRLARQLSAHTELLAGSKVLRHNPLRRLVARRGDTLVRISADEQPASDWLTALDLDVLARPTGRPSDHVTTWAWSHGEPLDVVNSAAGARAAGAALAALHDAPVDSVSRQVMLRDPMQSNLVATAADLSLLDRHLGARMASLVERAPDVREESGVLLHGDFSADQVVVGDGAQIVDLDRVCIADPVHDLASFAAVEAIRTGTGDGGPLFEALLDGYGRHPDRRRLASAQAQELLSRATEPLRAAHVDWRDGIAARLDQVEEVLA